MVNSVIYMNGVMRMNNFLTLINYEKRLEKFEKCLITSSRVISSCNWKPHEYDKQVY